MKPSERIKEIMMGNDINITCAIMQYLDEQAKEEPLSS